MRKYINLEQKGDELSSPVLDMGDKIANFDAF